MGKCKRLRLTVEQSLKIANNFIEVFKAFNNDVPCYLMSYPTENEELDKELEERDEYVTFEWSDRCPGKLKIHMHKITSEEDLYTNNTYELYYKGHKYVMKLFEKPEICGLYPEEEYDIEKHIFCSIDLVNIDDITVRCMQFTFDVENMKFLELFYIMRSVYKSFISKETGNLCWRLEVIKEPKSLVTLEKKLKGKVLGKVQKLE